jgi:hypothetical protein
VELVALVAPSLRGRRRTDPALRRTLWRVSLGLGLALATVQALAVSFGLETMVANASWYDAPPLPEPGWLFRIETTAALVIGTGLLALVALLLDQNRLGRGFALLLLLEAGVQLGWSGGELVHALRVGALTPLAAGLVLAGVAACCWAFSWLFAQRGPVPLPACGLWPLDVGLVVALGPPTLAALGLLIFPAELIADLVPGQRLYLEVVIAGVLLWVIPAATLFHWRRRRALWGPSRRVWMRTLGGSAAFLVALVLIDHVAWNQGAGLAWPGVLVVLSAYALAADWWTEIDAWRRSPGGRPLQILEQHQDPVDALAALAALRAADPDGHYAVTGLRFRALTWFFAPYVPLLVLGAPPDPSR